MKSQYKSFNTINYAGNKGEITEFVPLYPREVDIHYFGRGGLAGLLHNNHTEIHGYAMKVYKLENPVKYLKFNYDMLYGGDELQYSEEKNDTTYMMKAIFGVMGKDTTSMYFQRLGAIKEIIDEEVLEIYRFYAPLKNKSWKMLIRHLEPMPEIFAKFTKKEELNSADILAIKLSNLGDNILSECIPKDKTGHFRRWSAINKIIEDVNELRRRAYVGMIKMYNYHQLVESIDIEDQSFFNHTFNPKSNCVSLDPPYMFTTGYETAWGWKDDEGDIPVSKQNADAFCAIYNMKEILWFAKENQDKKIILHEYYCGWAFVFKYAYILFWGIQGSHNYEKVFSNEKLCLEQKTLFAEGYVKIVEKDGTAIIARQTTTPSVYRICQIQFGDKQRIAEQSQKYLEEYYEYKKIQFRLTTEIREQLKEAEDKIAFIQEFLENRRKTPYDLIPIEIELCEGIPIDDTFFGNDPSNQMLAYARQIMRQVVERKQKQKIGIGERLDLSYIFLLIKEKRLTAETAFKIKSMHEKQIANLKRAIYQFRNNFSSSILAMVLEDDADSFNDTFTALENTLAQLEIA
jgi:hypothetical protein